MDKIKQYNIITDIKPSYQRLDLPFHRSSPLKIEFNSIELELHYVNELGIWKQSSEVKQKNKTGGSEPLLIYTTYF